MAWCDGSLKAVPEDMPLMPIGHLRHRVGARRVAAQDRRATLLAWQALRPITRAAAWQRLLQAEYREVVRAMPARAPH